jgi:hypothetical protein
MQYTAKSSTLLKKTPVQGSTLADSEKRAISAGITFSVEKILDSDGLHSQVQLEGEVGAWWIFLPHWNSEGSGEVKATFSLKQSRSNSIIYGDLIFTEGEQEILRVNATSGLPGYQCAGAHTERGKGCIPPDNDWKISTDGYHLNCTGIDGMFYHITPDPDPTTGRSEFGLHRDANFDIFPGSAGSIAVKSDEFNGKVVPLINGLKDKQSFIPLNVIYT